MLNIVNTKNILGLKTTTGWEVTMFHKGINWYHISLEHEGFERNLKLALEKTPNRNAYELKYGATYKMYLDKGKMFSPEQMLNSIEILIG